MHEDVRASRLRISRRRALGLGGTVGLAGVLAACSGTGTTTATATASAPAAAPITAVPAEADLIALLDSANTCGLAGEETQGPYWFDVDSIRTDIREGRPGTEFALAVRVRDAACTPVPDCVVEIWHCDAGGVYSGFAAQSTGPGGGPRGAGSGATSDGSYSQGDQEAIPSDDGTYLRGAQVADATGIVQFTTIFPGWYRGRTTHVHVKVHIDRRTVLTTQLYVDDAVADEIYTASPYDARTGRDTTNANDSIYDPSGLLTMRQTATGRLGVINLGIDG